MFNGQKNVVKKSIKEELSSSLLLLNRCINLLMILNMLSIIVIIIGIISNKY